MGFEGFNKIDFETFEINGLDARMEAIRKRIQPKFKEVGESLRGALEVMTRQEMFLHIAKHLRRTINPPKDTWLAIGGNKRGYKQYPHFQLGLFDDHVFIWLAFIYELPDKRQIADKFISHFEEVKSIIPSDYLVSYDHTRKNAVKMNELDLMQGLVYFRDVKKAELLIGRHIQANDPILTKKADFIKLVEDTFEQLVPLYNLSVK